METEEKKKKYRVVCYMRIADDFLYNNYKEACEDRDHDEFMNPENIYKIEEVEIEKS